VNAPILEIVEAVDGAPLIPAQAIQLPHHQFITLSGNHHPPNGTERAEGGISTFLGDGWEGSDAS
jgi:hypothetical protein